MADEELQDSVDNTTAENGAAEKAAPVSPAAEQTDAQADASTKADEAVQAVSMAEQEAKRKAEEVEDAVDEIRSYGKKKDPWKGKRRFARPEDDPDVEAMPKYAECLHEETKVPKYIGAKKYYAELVYPTKAPQPAFEADYILEITKDYNWNINMGETVFVNSGSAKFNSQFEKAIYEYVHLEKGEFPILLYDRTISMSAKYGLVLTNKFIHVHTRGIIPYKIRIFKIKQVYVRFGLTRDDWSYILIMQKGSKKKYPLFKSLDAERVIELADVLMRMIYHLTPREIVKAKIEINGKMADDIDLTPEDESKIDLIFRYIARYFRRKFSSSGSDSAARIWVGIPEKMKQAAEEAAGEDAEDDGDGKKKKKKGKKGGKSGGKGDKGGKKADKGGDKKKKEKPAKGGKADKKKKKGK
jgi:hypothetical protein